MARRILPWLVCGAAGGLLAASGTSAFTVPSLSAPGIPQPGYPDFAAANYAATLTKTGGDNFTLSISATDPNVGIFNFPSAAYVVGNEQIKLTATFDSTGHLLTSMANTFEVDGSLKAWSNPDFGTAPGGFSWGAQPVEKLFSVSLTGVGVDSADEALGFSTGNFGGWANQTQFTGGGNPAESLWLFSLLGSLSSSGATPSSGGCEWTCVSNSAKQWNTFLASLKNHTKLSANTFYGIATIATVPLPPALWLLGGGLAALAFFRRRPQVTGSSQS